MKPLIVNFTNYKLAPLPSDASSVITIQEGVKNIFQDEDVLKFHPERRLNTDNQVMYHLMETVTGYDNATRYDVFLTDKTRNECIAEIDIITNKGLLKYYPFFNEITKQHPEYKGTWLIEYYLDSRYWNNGMMSILIKKVINHIFENGVKCISAVTNKDNVASERVLIKSGFQRSGMLNKDQTHWVLMQE